MQRTPAKRTEGIESLAVAFLFGFCFPADESVGLELFLNRVLNACDPYQGRSDRDRFYRPRNPAGPDAAPSRQFNDQRHVDSSVVDKKTVFVFAVFAQRLAVIAQKRNQAIVIELVKLQPCDQSPEFMIRIGDLSVIQMAAVLGAIRLRWVIRTVRIVQVQPEKKRPARILLEPRQGASHAFARATINQPQISVDEGFGRERVVVEIKSASQAPTAVENEGADHRARSVPVLLKRLRDRAKARLQRLASEI